MNIDPNIASFVAQFISTIWSIFIGKTISEMMIEWRARRKARSSSSHSGRQGKRVIIMIRAALMLILTCIAIILYNSGIISINLSSDKSARIQSTAVQSTPPTRFHGRRGGHRKGRAALSPSSTLAATPAPSPTWMPPTATSVATPAPSPSPTQVPPTATPIVIPTLLPTPPVVPPTPAPTPTAQGL